MIRRRAPPVDLPAVSAAALDRFLAGKPPATATTLRRCLTAFLADTEHHDLAAISPLMVRRYLSAQYRPVVTTSALRGFFATLVTAGLLRATPVPPPRRASADDHLARLPPALANEVRRFLADHASISNKLIILMRFLEQGQICMAEAIIPEAVDAHLSTLTPRQRYNARPILMRLLKWRATQACADNAEPTPIDE